MAGIKSNLRIASYNSTGLNKNKMDYIQQFLDKEKIDILFLQETWLLSKNSQKLREIHKDFLYHGISGVPDNELLRGRPYSGTAILYHRSLSSWITRICIESRRISGILLKMNSSEILLLNCYMPCDTYSRNNMNDDFLNTCDTIE